MNSTTRSYLIFATKVLVVLGVFFWIAKKTINHYSTDEVLEFQRSIFLENDNLIWVILVVFLMPINWFIESRKWSISLRQEFSISAFSSLKSVLAGVAVGIFTPNRIGEFVGRVLTIPEKHRTQGVFSNALCSLSQLTITLIMGSFCLIFLIPSYLIVDAPLIVILVQAVIALFALLVVLFYVRSTRLLKVLSKIKWLKKLLKSPALHISLSRKMLIPLIGNSLVRYFIFSIQFIAMLTFFKVELNEFLHFLHIPIIYLILAIVPTIALSELGIREGVTLAVLSGISENMLGIISASFTLWIINIAVPAVFGSLVLLQLKMKSKTHK